MTDILAVHPLWFLMFTLMGLATYATRLSGLLLMRGIVVKGRLKAALDAVPPSILLAAIAPIIFMSSKAETIAAVITAIAAFLRLPLLVTIAIGVVSVAGLRWLGV